MMDFLIGGKEEARGDTGPPIGSTALRGVRAEECPQEQVLTVRG